MNIKLPKKITIILSFLLLLIAVHLLYVAGFSEVDLWGHIGMVCVFISWGLLFLLIE